MALKKCKDCGQQVSKNAETCPNCGAKLKRKRTSTFTWLIAIFIAVWAFTNLNPQKPNTTAKKTLEKPPISDTECKKDIYCWAQRNAINAELRCYKKIEKLAKYQFKWTDGFLEKKFNKYAWADKTHTAIVYYGDKIQFQNGFGAFQNHIYSCTYNPTTDIATNAAAKPKK